MIIIIPMPSAMNTTAPASSSSQSGSYQLKEVLLLLVHQVISKSIEHLRKKTLCLNTEINEDVIYNRDLPTQITYLILYKPTTPLFL